MNGKTNPMKRTLFLTALLSLSIAAIAATVSVTPDRLYTCVLTCRGSAPAAFPAVAGRGHALVLEAQGGAAVVTVKHVPFGAAVTNTVGAVTNGFLKAASTLGLPPLREGDLLLFAGPANQTNRVTVTYAADKRLGPPN